MLQDRRCYIQRAGLDPTEATLAEASKVQGTAVDSKDQRALGIFADANVVKFEDLEMGTCGK